MKIKIGDKIYNPNEEPVMIMFDTNKEKLELIKNISKMDPNKKKYCMCPSKMDNVDIKKFMQT